MGNRWGCDLAAHLQRKTEEHPATHVKCDLTKNYISDWLQETIGNTIILGGIFLSSGMDLSVK